MSIQRVILLSLTILVVGFLVGWLVGVRGATLNGVAFLALPVLIVGFLIGWLVEWIIDNQYRRLREVARSGAATMPTEPGGEVSELAQTLREAFAEREGEVHDLGDMLQEQAVRYGQLKAQFDRYVQTHPDDLTVIRGVGRTYQKKLREAGYSTFAQLAAADARRLREALRIKEWQKTDPQSWIDQAMTLFQQT